uniref:Integrator complex subunit 7 n=1 Tax=Meloidogyne floridensis TaxID=298350 RepID=A0A915NSN9_9BILA
MQLHVEKGLQSSNLADVMTTITECARYIREYPFPHFVHATLFRLAQTFNGEIFARKFEHSMNTIRLRIVVAIKECNKCLSLAFSTEEIIRFILKVSHSNDYKARSLTLLFLGSLAPLTCEDKKVHNLIIESLDCVEMTELSAAIQAANELAKFSISFSSLIIRKIAEMFGKNFLEISLKNELFGIISNLRGLSVSKSSIELGRRLLEGLPTNEMHSVIYCSLSKLSSRCETILPEQISLLLSELEKVINQRNKILVHCILQNLSSIAEYRNFWTIENIKAIRDFYHQINLLSSKSILCTWLHCMNVISSTEFHSKILLESYPWSVLLNFGNIVVRIFAIKLSLNLLLNGEMDAQFQQTLLNSILVTLCQFIDNPTSPSSIFLFLVSKFVCSPKCTPRFASSLVRNILRSELTSSSDEFFQLLAVINENYWRECREIVNSSLFSAISNSKNFNIVPPIVFTILLSTMPFSLLNQSNDQNLTNFAGQIISNNFNYWTIYKIARSALRFGHWRYLALPLLEKIQTSCESIETESWISSLIYICKAQPLAFNMDELANSESNLQFASLNLKFLGSTEKSQPFGFAVDYVNCLESTFRGIHSVLTTFNVLRLLNSEKRQIVIQSLGTYCSPVMEARQQWVCLCSRSFDADTQTLLQMGLMIRMCLLIEQYLGILCDPGTGAKLSEISMEDLGESTQKSFQASAQTQGFLELLCWARNELIALQSTDPDPIRGFKVLVDILQCLVDFPLGLPRFFFQRVQFTRIRLIISPQPSDGRGVFKVSSMDLLPVVIEGIIESTNKRSIESVCVVLTLKRDNLAHVEKKQTIQLEPEQKYFKSQFLLKITHQKTRIKAKVWFLDAVTKKQWFDETDSATLTVELLDGAGTSAAGQSV